VASEASADARDARLRAARGVGAGIIVPVTSTCWPACLERSSPCRVYEPLPVPPSDALELLVDSFPVVPTLRGSALEGLFPALAFDKTKVGIVLACARRVAVALVGALDALAPV
jgi:hypothetical protein